MEISIYVICIYIYIHIIIVNLSSWIGCTAAAGEFDASIHGNLL